MVDPRGEVYIVTTIQGGAGLFLHLPSSAWGSTQRVHVTSSTRIHVPLTTHKDPVGGDISPDGRGILIKTTDNVYYWQLNNLEAMDSRYEAAVATPPVALPYSVVWQDRGICWKYDNSGYYTIAGGFKNPEGYGGPLNFYPRLLTDNSSQ
jgi:hypothetical protein